MGKVTPNEITAYFDACIYFIVENDWDNLTAREIANL
jgi:hypothetical protein